MSEDAGEKTEEPTAHKLSKAREEGQVPKSQELNTIFVLLGGLLSLVTMGPWMWDRLIGLLRHFFWEWPDFHIETGVDLMAVLFLAMREFLIMILPLSLVIMVLGVLSNMFQLGGFMFTTKPLMPNLGKINPIKGFGRFFSMKSIVDSIKNTLKIAVIFFVAYLVIKSHLPVFAVMGDMEPAQIGLYTLKVCLELFFKTCIFVGVVAIADFAYQRWNFLKEMRMSKQEIKEEFKQMDGDPLVKGRIRQAQREAAKKRMLGDVPRADAVITNPTHFAIAIRYNAKEAAAPVVLAKGQDFLALRIKEIAQEHKVPLVENKPLAQALYKVVEVGQMIPLEFYKAVAEVLGYVYRLKGRRPDGRKPGN